MNKNKLIFFLIAFVLYVIPVYADSQPVRKVFYVNPTKQDLINEELIREQELKNAELEKLKEENKKLEQELKVKELERQKEAEKRSNNSYYTPAIIQYRYYPRYNTYPPINYFYSGINYTKLSHPPKPPLQNMYPNSPSQNMYPNKKPHRP